MALLYYGLVLKAIKGKIWFVVMYENWDIISAYKWLRNVLNGLQQCWHIEILTEIQTARDMRTLFLSDKFIFDHKVS